MRSNIGIKCAVHLGGRVPCRPRCGSRLALFVVAPATQRRQLQFSGDVPAVAMRALRGGGCGSCALRGVRVPASFYCALIAFSK